jgi:hypothetical protein
VDGCGKSLGWSCGVMLEHIIDFACFFGKLNYICFHTLEILYLCVFVDIKAITLYTVTFWTAAY